MSLHVPVVNAVKNGKKLTLLHSGRNYNLIYETEGQRINLKSSMNSEGYAMYMFNLFKKDLGFDNKLSEVDDIKSIIKKEIMDNLEIDICLDRTFENNVTIKLSYDGDCIDYDDILIDCDCIK